MSSSSSIEDDKPEYFYEIRKNLYERYENELRYLYNRSTFLWAFLTILFTAYGYLVANFFLGKELQSGQENVLYFAVFGLCFMGVIFSSIWIAMAKASAATEESYVFQIEAFESYPFDGIDFPPDWTLWTSTKTCKTDDRFSSLAEGGFSVKKLNTFIAQVVFFSWCAIFSIHILCWFTKCLALGFLIAGAFILTIALTQHHLKTKCGSGWIGKPNFWEEGRKALMIIDDAIAKQPEGAITFSKLNEYYGKHVKCINFLLSNFFDDDENCVKNEITRTFQEEIYKYSNNKEVSVIPLIEALKDYRKIVEEKLDEKYMEDFEL